MEGSLRERFEVGERPRVSVLHLFHVIIEVLQFLQLVLSRLRGLFEDLFFERLSPLLLFFLCLDFLLDLALLFLFQPLYVVLGHSTCTKFFSR